MSGRGGAFVWSPATAGWIEIPARHYLKLPDRGDRWAIADVCRGCGLRWEKWSSALELEDRKGGKTTCSD